MAYGFLEGRALREGERTMCCTEATADATPSLSVLDKLGARGFRGGILLDPAFLLSTSARCCASA